MVPANDIPLRARREYFTGSSDCVLKRRASTDVEELLTIRRLDVGSFRQRRRTFVGRLPPLSKRAPLPGGDQPTARSGYP
jgi:hypothetical protein